MNRREEVVELIKDLRKTMTFEQIASAVEVSYPTVYAWSRGSRRPSNLTKKALLKMLNRKA